MPTGTPSSPARIANISDSPQSTPPTRTAPKLPVRDRVGHDAGKRPGASMVTDEQHDAGLAVEPGHRGGGGASGAADHAHARVDLVHAQVRQVLDPVVLLDDDLLGAAREGALDRGVGVRVRILAIERVVLPSATTSAQRTSPEIPSMSTLMKTFMRTPPPWDATRFRLSRNDFDRVMSLGPPLERLETASRERRCMSWGFPGASSSPSGRSLCFRGLDVGGVDGPSTGPMRIQRLRSPASRNAG